MTVLVDTGEQAEKGRASLRTPGGRFASAGGGHRLVRVGYPDHERDEIQDQLAHRLGSGRGDGLLPAGEPGVSGALSPGDADRLGTLEAGGAQSASGSIWGSPCRDGDAHHVPALWTPLKGLPFRVWSSFKTVNDAGRSHPSEDMLMDNKTRKKETVKAIRLHSKSGPAGMVYEEAPRPYSKAGEVLVRVYAAAMTPGEHLWPETWKTATGQERFQPIPGHAFSGVVVETGSDVTQFAVGDAVYGYTDARRDGAQAEYCLAFPSELALKPASLDHVQAAAVPLSALTAWQAFFDHAQLSADQRVLIHGAAGGVGLFAVQLAHWIGAHVIGTASARHHELLRALGATEVIDYNTTRFEEVVQDLDLVLDTRGGTCAGYLWYPSTRIGL
jgi:hypothetical protein